LQKRAHWYSHTGLPLDEKFIYKKPNLKMSFLAEAIMLENAARNHNFHNYCARATLGICPPTTPYNLLDYDFGRLRTEFEKSKIIEILKQRNVSCDLSKNAYDDWEITMVIINHCPCGHNGKTLPTAYDKNCTIEAVRVGTKRYEVGQIVKDNGRIEKFDLNYSTCRVNATIKYKCYNYPFSKSIDIVNL